MAATFRLGVLAATCPLVTFVARSIPHRGIVLGSRGTEFNYIVIFIIRRVLNAAALLVLALPHTPRTHATLTHPTPCVVPPGRRRRVVRRRGTGRGSTGRAGHAAALAEPLHHTTPHSPLNTPLCARLTRRSVSRRPSVSEHTTHTTHTTHTA